MEKVLDVKVKEVQVYLEKNFGIKTTSDLNMAIKKMPQLNMNVFVYPLKSK